MNGVNEITAWLAWLGDIPRIIGLVAQTPAAVVAGGAAVFMIAVKIFCKLGVEQ